MSLINQNKTCRCCLNDDINENKLLNMATTYLYESKASNQNIFTVESYFVISGIDTFCLPIDTEFKICISCKDRLESSYSFRELCRTSNDSLVNSSIKEEPSDPYNTEIANIICEDVKVDYLEPKVTIETVKTEQHSEKESKKKAKRTQKSKTKAPTLPSKTVVKKSIGKAENSAAPVILVDSKEQLSIDFVEAKFVCMFCDRACKNYAMLILHRKCHNFQNFTRQCQLCGEENLLEYEKHVEQTHPKYRPQQCLICSTNYINHKELKAHLKTHLPPAKYQCMGCGKLNKTQYALRSHIVRNCGKPTTAKTAYNCHVCGLLFDKIALLNKHVRDDHPKDYCAHFYPCYSCKKIYSSHMGYKLGCKQCKIQASSGRGVDNKLPLIDCNECNEKLFDNEDLLCHNIRNHQLPGCYCFECDKGLLNVNEFRRHKTEQHSKKIRDRKEKRHMCDECGKCFASPYHLRDHVLYHSNDNLIIKCTMCSASFRAAYHLKRHIKQSHNRTFSFECNECGKRVDSKNYLKIHFARAHFPFMRNYHCDACPRSFASITDKKRHMVTHTGDRAALSAAKPKDSGDMILNLAGQRRPKQESDLHLTHPTGFDGFFNQHPLMQSGHAWPEYP